MTIFNILVLEAIPKYDWMKSSENMRLLSKNAYNSPPPMRPLTLFG